MQSSFADALQRASPDFQKDAEGYGIDKAGEANLNICGHAIGERFKCLSFTLEMPFKDTERCPDDFQGWSVAVMHDTAQLSAAFQLLFERTVCVTLRHQSRCRSPERSIRLGAAFLNAVADVCSQL